MFPCVENPGDGKMCAAKNSCHYWLSRYSSFYFCKYLYGRLSIRNTLKPSWHSHNASILRNVLHCWSSFTLVGGTNIITFKMHEKDDGRGCFRQKWWWSMSCRSERTIGSCLELSNIEYRPHLNHLFSVALSAFVFCLRVRVCISVV